MIARYGHTANFHNDILYIFGGQNAKGLIKDSQMIDFSNKDPIFKSKEEEVLRSGHSLVICGDKQIIFGGIYKNNIPMLLIKDIPEF